MNFPIIDRVFKNKYFKIFLVFLVIYIIWSIYVDLACLYENIDDDFLIPCLFYLPPIGFLALGFIIFRLIGSSIIMRLMQWRLDRKKKVDSQTKE